MNLVIINANAIGGWIICDWAHEFPQLFNLVSYAPSATISETYARVDMV
jgi:hypothetical protein